ncbi:glycosyltransferase involved in cell wall biosynthesis [Actimicrobium sp. GrIS 1.19]|uniref:glycosyltransferase family 4 protein n=1 Tax=Actimicrobium sp. GrIS 1.19 TaxID=3071708 RepID=UPI002E03D81D|nr:glycosyltransferase involved in cell wall biosynthesis [Actimicrobium sp. GrIS 1.19]
MSSRLKALTRSPLTARFIVGKTFRIAHQDPPISSIVRILYHHRTQGEEPESIHIKAIVDALGALGHEVLVVGPAAIQHQGARGSRPSLLGRIKNAAPRLLFELMQLGYNIVVAHRLAKAIKQFKPHLVYERYALFNFAGVRVAKRYGIPLILEVNTPYAQAWAKYYGLYLKTLARWLEKRILLAASHIITVTEVQRELLVHEGIPPQQISTCHNAIDPDWFNPERHLNPDLAAELGLMAPVIGFVGTMNRWQGMSEFPAVLRSVFARCPEATFLFVGDGEFRQSLEDVCVSEGFSDRVVFTRRKPHADVPPLVALMDITVLLNSNAYGSPMKIFEYMAMGKAIVAPSVAPVLEVLHDGQTGLLIEPGDTTEMADQIVRLIRDPALRDRLGKAGRAYVTKHHTWHQNALKIVSIYGQQTLATASKESASTC